MCKPTYPAPLLAVCAAMAVLGCGDDGNSPSEPATATRTEIPEAALTSNTWTTRANMPTDRWFVATATFPTGTGAASLYVIGGSNSNHGTLAPLGKVQVYNPATNTWVTKASTPHVVAGYGNNGAQVINGLIYLPGGMRNWQGYGYLQVYNPATNTWVDKAPLPQITPNHGNGLALGASAAIDGKLYVAGICLFENTECGYGFMRYDPATNHWTLLPLPRTVVPNRIRGGVLNKKFYITDGTNLEAYDPATNTWTLKAPVPARRFEPAAASVNNKLYIVGGVWPDLTLTGRVDVYDPVTNTWTKKAPSPRIEYGLSAGRVVVNGQARLELVGGARPGNNLQYTP
jgi:N-acetylneuraminic acid mutarotase